MKLQYASDLHLEFENNSNYLKKNPLKPSADYLLLAGDIGYLDSAFSKSRDLDYKDHAEDFLKYCSDNWKKTIIVPGNHEYYGGYHLDAANPTCHEIYKNVTVLNNAINRLEDGDETVAIVGATLWTNVNPINYYGVLRGMNDYNYIKFDSHKQATVGDTVEAFMQSFNFIKSRLASIMDEKHKKVILTHHGCHYECIAEAYRTSGRSSMNDAYYTDLESFILQYEPAAWVYGHTHDHREFEVGKTKVVTNGLGYVGYDPIEHFNHSQTIEV